MDVDKVQALAAKYRVSAMPTFKFVKGGKEVDEVSDRIVSPELTENSFEVHHPLSSMPKSPNTLVQLPPLVLRRLPRPQLQLSPTRSPFSLTSLQRA